MNWYGWLKVLHVLAAIVWIGGGAALGIIAARLARARDRTTIAALLPQIVRYMQSVAGPSSGIVLLTGIAMVVNGHLGFRTLWVSLGFVGWILHGLWGGLVTRKRAEALAAAAASGADDALTLAGARLWSSFVVYLVTLAFIVGVMVLKPTL